MSQKPISEHAGKHLLARWLPHYMGAQHDVVKLDGESIIRITPETELESLPSRFPWLLESKIVVKPDQLLKRRGKSGLILLNASWADGAKWLQEHRNKIVTIGSVSAPLTHFLVEKFVAHEGSTEHYICMKTVRDGNMLLYCREGGVDVGDVDAKAQAMKIPMRHAPSVEEISASLLANYEGQQDQTTIATFLQGLYKLFVELNFAYLEVNPLVITTEGIHILDLAAKLDSAASFECAAKWGDIEFPAPFGHKSLPEEEFIHQLDEKTGASLKLTVLNMKGRVWLMVAGGGASVIFADTLSDLGYGHEMANYGEYSGAPTERQTFDYARTVIDLMCREKHPDGKVLLIGGGIANFTDVAETFKGIVRALRAAQQELRDGNVRILVRRGGPNYEEGLRMMQELSVEIRVPIVVRGPETHMTAIVRQGLEELQLPLPPAADHEFDVALKPQKPVARPPSSSPRPWYHLFTKQTRAVVFGMQTVAVQGMIDFDYMCGRATPSVAAMVYPFASSHFQKFYWGTNEVLFPIYQTLEAALQKFPEVDTLVNFASYRSVFSTTMDALALSDKIKNIAIIAEGVPENNTRTLNAVAKEKGVVIIGPATVGGIKPGCFKIGNTGGMLDNILASKLYRSGSVAYVSKSGGMSNELNNIICRNSDGVYEGIAIGGDRYPGTSFMDHLRRYEADPECKMLVLLGEVGGTDEYDVCRALQSGEITKPVVAWCTGTCAKCFPYEVQFGHSGALANADVETADAKNSALRAAGAVVPNSFDEFGRAINAVFKKLLEHGIAVVKPEPTPPKIPMDYAWARKLGLVRKPASFVSTISDDRGEELLYAGMPISKVFDQQVGIGGVISLLWFKRLLPDYFCKFVEMVLILTADHGPAVSGAHNTIVTARAGKDLISSLTAGLLTIGPRFGGALDDAATQFSSAFDRGLTAQQFVEEMRRKMQLIMGIGHRVKSLHNPDMRVTIIKDFAKRHFPSTKLLDFALEVEKITTLKKSNLILNVDGCVAVCFVDLVRNCGAFTREEADEYMHLGVLNGLFVVGRSIGFIGHYLDQKRLKQDLYRHPWDDIAYTPSSFDDLS